MRNSTTHGALAFTAASLIVLLCGVYLRFVAIDEIGIRGDDTLYYFALLEGWAEPLYPHFRLVAMTLYQGAFAWFNGEDWSIKVLNAGLDVLSILLLAATTWVLSKDRWLAWGAALLYATAPRLIAFARTELLHTLGTFLLLVALLLFVLSIRTHSRWLGRLLLLFTGVFVGLNFSVHEDSLFFFPGLVVYLFIHRLIQGERVFSAVIQSSWLVVPCIVTALNFGLFSIATAHLEALAAPTGDRAAASARLVVLDWSYWVQSVRGFVLFNTSQAIYLAFLISLFCASILVPLRKMFFARFNRETITDACAPMLGTHVMYFPLALIASYVLCYNTFVHILFPRVFLPGVPVVFLLILLWLNWLTLTRYLSKEMLIICVALIACLNFLGYKATVQQLFAMIPQHYIGYYRLYAPITVPIRWHERFSPSRQPRSTYRVIYDLLRDKVDTSNRVLITPYAVSGGERRGFRHYFRGNAAYIEDCDSDLQTFVAENKVRYVVIAGFHVTSNWAEPVCYDWTHNQYTVEKDVMKVKDFVERAGSNTRVLLQQGSTYVFDLKANR